MTIFDANNLENITCGQRHNLQFQVVYDQNHYFGLGPIPKPKVADTFGQYHNRYQNHISKEESSYWVNLAKAKWGNFSIIKGPIKPNLLPNFKHFKIIFEDLGLFSSLQKLISPKKWDIWEKIWKKIEKKFRLWKR